MFIFAMDNSTKFKKFVEGLGSIIDIAKIRVTNEGVTFCELDRSHVQFVKLFLDKTFFEVFKFESEEKEEVFNLDIIEFKKIVKCPKIGELLEFRKLDEKSTLEFITDDEVRIIYNLASLDIGNYEAPSPPELDYKEGSVIEIPSDLIYTTLYNMDKLKFGKVKLSIDEDKFILKSESKAEGENIQLEYLHGELSKNINKTWSCYTLNKLVPMTKLKFTDTSIISLGRDMPLTLKQELDNGSYLSLLLAPRIESEE